MRGHQGVKGQEAQRGRAVDEDEVELHVGAGEIVVEGGPQAMLGWFLGAVIALAVTAGLAPG